MSKQKDFKNPDMKEIHFKENRTMSNPAKAGGSVKKSQVKKNAASAGKAFNQPKQLKKRGFFCLTKKDTAASQAPADTDPLNDLELIDLMDDDALERLAEKDWEKDMKIASIPRQAAKDTKEPSKLAAKVNGTSTKETNQGSLKTVPSATGTGVVTNSAKTNGGNSVLTQEKKSENKTQYSVKPAASKSYSGKSEALKATPVRNSSVRNSSVRNSSVRNSSVRRGYTSFSHIKISMVAITLLICVLAGIVANRMLVIKQRTDVLASFVGIGSGLADVQVIGQQGLIAVSEGRKQALEAEQRKQQEKEQAEKDALAEKDRVQVELVCQTIMGDLKIKFVNEETKRVIAGVPFCAEVKGPDGKVVQYVNEDRDGIIYLSPVPAGEYTITMGDVPIGEKYKKYVKATKSGYVAVSDTINYEVVDVTDEVVTEAEAADEQKVVNDIVEENVLQDTVAFVESTKTLISGGEGYKQIDKSQVKLPSGQARGRVTGNFVFMADGDESLDSSENSSQAEENKGASEGKTNPPDSATGGSDPAKTYTAQINAAPTSMKAGETATLKASSDFANPTYDWFISAGAGDEVSFLKGKQGAEVSIKAEKAGSVTLTCRVADADTQLEPIPVSCTIAIEEEQTQAPSTEINPAQKITTVDNKTIYVKNDAGNYVEATYGDYQADKALYVQTNETPKYNYTGWQVIDGATYYYTADNQRVTGEQVIRGVKYTFNGDGVLQTGNTNTGIDVSAHQGAIDWAAVKSAGVSFAIIRVGFRGYGTGRLVEDSYFRQNLQGAASNGIRVGAYIFSAATNEAEAVEEASLAINLIKGYNISYPVYIDMESSGTGTGRADNLSVATRTAIVHAFCRTVANAGYKPGVYSNTTWYNNYLNAPEFTKYSIWLAQYNTHVTYTRTKYDIWQYSSKGSIPGIGTRVDMNWGYTSY